MKKKADWKLHRKKKKKDFATTTFLPQKKEVLLTSATQKAIALSFARTNERETTRFERAGAASFSSRRFVSTTTTTKRERERERERERAIRQPTFDVLEAVLGKNERGVKTSKSSSSWTTSRVARSAQS
tara:strand:- start:133 stop:519 length:387 start_codon:yes stop_codon:yes gene_type:complete